jgi:hypothetical protein
MCYLQKVHDKSHAGLYVSYLYILSHIWNGEPVDEFLDDVIDNWKFLLYKVAMIVFGPVGVPKRFWRAFTP